MTTESNTTSLAKFGPVGAPILGAALLVLFIAVAYVGGDVAAGRDDLTGKVREVNARLGEQKAQLPAAQLPSLDAVKTPMSINGRPGPVRMDSSMVHTLPTAFRVNVQNLAKDEFDTFDEDLDTFWSPTEFRLTEYPSKLDANGKPATESQFDAWDVNPKDKKISREEWKNRPAGLEVLYAKMNTNSSDGLKPPEITAAELEKLDRNGDDEVSLAEFLDRTPRDDVELGPATDLVAVADEKAMTITVSWTAPKLALPPPDVAYLIERFCPETRQKRQQVYDRLFVDYFAASQAWEARFKAWWDEPSSDGNEIPRNQDKRWSDPKKAKEEFAKTDAPPTAPLKPDDWEPVATVTETQYVDSKFDTDVTYLYAVRVVTEKVLKRGVKADKVEGTKKYSVPCKQTGRPLRIRNVIQMEYGPGAGADDANPWLSKWHWLGQGDSTGWYRVRIKEAATKQQRAIGDVYGLAQLKERAVEVTKAGQATKVGADAVEALFGADAKIDFRTGFNFEAQMNHPQGTLLNHAVYGECELPRGKVPADQPAPSSATMLEIRVLGVALRGESVWVEINRWHQVGDKWYRVEMIRKVAKGTEAGAMVNLASPGEGVSVYGAGVKLEGDALKALVGGTLDLSVGKFEAVEGRSIKLGADKLDLSGAIYR